MKHLQISFEAFEGITDLRAFKVYCALLKIISWKTLLGRGRLEERLFH